MALIHEALGREKQKGTFETVEARRINALVSGAATNRVVFTTSNHSLGRDGESPSGGGKKKRRCKGGNLAHEGPWCP